MISDFTCRLTIIVRTRRLDQIRITVVAPGINKILGKKKNFRAKTSTSVGMHGSKRKNRFIKYHITRDVNSTFFGI